MITKLYQMKYIKKFWDIGRNQNKIHVTDYLKLLLPSNVHEFVLLKTNKDSICNKRCISISWSEEYRVNLLLYK